MKRTDITCPSCFKGKVLTTTDDTVNDNRTWCDQCGEDFILNGPTSLRFGVEPQPKKEKKAKVVKEEPKESEYHVTLYDSNEQSSSWVSIMASSSDEAAEMAISNISVTRVEKQ